MDASSKLKDFFQLKSKRMHVMVTGQSWNVCAWMAWKSTYFCWCIVTLQMWSLVCSWWKNGKWGEVLKISVIIMTLHGNLRFEMRHTTITNFAACRLGTIWWLEDLELWCHLVKNFAELRYPKDPSSKSLGITFSHDPHMIANSRWCPFFSRKSYWFDHCFVDLPFSTTQAKASHNEFLLALES